MQVELDIQTDSRLLIQVESGWQTDGRLRFRPETYVKTDDRRAVELPPADPRLGLRPRRVAQTRLWASESHTTRMSSFFVASCDFITQTSKRCLANPRVYRQGGKSQRQKDDLIAESFRQRGFGHQFQVSDRLADGELQLMSVDHSGE